MLIYVKDKIMEQIIKNKKKYYLALDSDVCRYLLSNKSVKEGKTVVRDNEPWFVDKYGKVIDDLINEVEDDRIRLVGTRTLVGECPNENEDRNELYHTKLYFPDFESEEYQKTNKFISKLAETYAPKGEEHTVLGRVYCPVMRGSRPCNDAYMMAEASVEGLHLLTNNLKDFNYDRKLVNKRSSEAGISAQEFLKAHPNFFTKERIRRMNRDNGIAVDVHGRKRAPYPVCLYELAEIFEKNEFHKLLLKFNYPRLKRYEDLSEKTRAVIDNKIDCGTESEVKE